MKFGKEFASQMVPEWQAAYMNYNHLKILIKEILIFRGLQQNGSSPSCQPNPPPPPPLEGSSRKRKVSLHRALSGLTSSNPNKDNEDEVILVNAMQQSEEHYRTTFLRSSEDGGGSELHFFRRLDDEFNKVINFYKPKVKEMVNEAEELSKQMNALIALRMKVEDPAFCSSSPVFSSRSFTDERITEVIQENNMRSEGNSHRRMGSDRIDKEQEMVSLGVLKHVKINILAETPISSLKKALSGSKSAGFAFSKKELRDAERKLKQAFIEFHQKLRYLKSYSFLNRLAFSKIMKKYDKVTSRNASKAYLEMVDKSYLCQSDEVAKLVESVETVFIEHFSNGNSAQGRKMLRLQTKTDKHRITFFMGCFVGCSFALVVAIILITHARDLIISEGRNRYMTNVFPLYSVFGYLVLHMLMYAGNVYYWKRFRVNYTFIFGFKPTSALGFRGTLLLSSGLSVLTLAAILSNLEMDIDERNNNFKVIPELLPLGLVIVVLLIAFCPFNIIYRTDRFFLIACLWRCICAPLYKVTLPDFFLADQLTSQVQLFRNLQFYICYYGWGDYKKRESTTCRGTIYDSLFIIVAIIPYWIRCLQCLRRLFEGEDSSQAVNALKYFSTIVAVIARTFYSKKKGLTLKIVAASTSGVATVFSTYWDLVCDWGLLRRNSENPWLRDKLILPHRSLYFIAMVVNVILRLAWMQTVLDLHEAPFVHRAALTAMVASLEIIRRGMWNFFRLENEHLNNVGKYRAFKSVPLPFSYQNNKDL